MARLLTGIGDIEAILFGERTLPGDSTLLGGSTRTGEGERIRPEDGNMLLPGATILGAGAILEEYTLLPGDKVLFAGDTADLTGQTTLTGTARCGCAAMVG